MDTATPALKPLEPLEAETAFVPKSPVRPKSAGSDASSTAANLEAPASPVTLLSLSLSTEQENPEDAYILLDECFSGSLSTSPKMSTSSATPSPGNTLTAPVPTQYPSLGSSADSKSLNDLSQQYVYCQSPHSSGNPRRSTGAVLEHVPRQSKSETDGGTDVGIWDCQSASHSTDPEFTGHSKSGNGNSPPALPAKMIVSDVEYDVPSSAFIRESALHPAAPTIMHSPSVPPPQPHMVNPGWMHRYVNTAPRVVQNPSAVAQKNYVESSAIHSLHPTQPMPQTSSSPLLPPKAHG